MIQPTLPTLPTQPTRQTSPAPGPLRRLIQVVPELPPEIGGVAAYAELLAAALAPRGFSTLFVASRRPGRLSRPDLLEIEPRPDALAAALRPAAAAAPTHAVVLHYVGYGFAARGCPGWLAAGLERAARQEAAAPLVTLFHETWVGGPPWTHRFWLLPRQQGLVRRLARRSARCLATSGEAAAALQALLPATAPPVQLLPSPSTFGEPALAAWPAHRPPRLVVLGLPPVRGRVYTAGREALLRFCARAAIEEIHDVGPPVAAAPRALGGLPVRIHGTLAPAEVGSLLLASRYLAVHFPRGAAAKSTVVAAGMAHGCAVLNCAEVEPPDDGLSAWMPASWDGAGWRRAAEEGYELYCRRRAWQVVAAAIASCLQ